MTKLELKTPTEKIIEKGKEALDKTVTDSDGKVYELRVPDEVDKFDLNIALGTNSTNLGALLQVMPLLYIQSINGETFYFTATYSGLRAGLKVIGSNGMKVVSEAMQRYLMPEQGDEGHGVNLEIKK